METATGTISSEQRNGNLFISLRGDYQREWRPALGSFIGKYEGSGNIFINTEKLSSLLPAVREELKEIFTTLARVQKRIFFLGQKGFDICPDGHRVIVKKGCCGRCRNCGC